MSFTTSIPPAEVLGEWTSQVGRRLGQSAHAWSQTVQSIVSQKVAAAPGILRSTWEKAVDFSGVLSPPSRHSSASRQPLVERSPSEESRRPSLSVSSIGVGVMEYATPREPLMEVSMLESLGFYDPDNTVVVKISNPAPAAASLPRARPNRLLNDPFINQDRHRATVPSLPQQGGGAQLIPDLELGDWSPHVIARSKLGSRSFRLTTVGIAALIGLSAIILIIGSVRQPRSEAVRAEAALVTEATGLMSALDGLEAALAAGSPGPYDATIELIEVETAARGLFEAASQIDADDQADLRSISTDISRQALDLKNRVTGALSYRVVLAPFWQSPQLTGLSDPGEAAAALAPWQAQMTELASALPVSEELGEHATAVATFNSDFPIWAETYLDALALEDISTADQQLVILEASLAELAQAEENTVVGIIEGARRQAEILIEELAQLIAGRQTP